MLLMQYSVCLLFTVTEILQFAAGRVLELDERFLEHRKDTPFLVLFYAPWCGHCKRLDPVYNQVASALDSSPIAVGRVDCTRFSNIASEFSIKGFPVIKFMKGSEIYTHRGERTKENIIDFVSKAHGPAVRNLPSSGKYSEAFARHKDDLFFLYVGDEDPHADLHTKYVSVANQFITQAYFYAATKSVLPKNIKPLSHPTVLVFKDNAYLEFVGDEENTKTALEKWVNSERYTSFPKVGGATINDMAGMKKLLVILAVNQDTNDKDITSNNESALCSDKFCHISGPVTNDALCSDKFCHISGPVTNEIKVLLKNLALNKREQYHEKFQFLWMTDIETANSITMSFSTGPILFVLNPETHEHFFPNVTVLELNNQKLETFLNDVQSGDLQGEGGTSFFQRLRRVFFDLSSTILGIWQTSRWLFLLMFGLPGGVISILCYSLCCMESVEGEYYSDEEDEDIVPVDQARESEAAIKDSHEKKD